MRRKYSILSATIVALIAVLFLTSGVSLATDQKCDPAKCKEVCKVPCNTATAQATQAAAKDCCKGDSTCCKKADGKCPMAADGKCTMTADGKCPKSADGKCSHATGDMTCPKTGEKCNHSASAKASTGTDAAVKKASATPGKA
jgi:hypothetical protein